MNNVKSYTDKQLLAKVKTLTGFKTIPADYWIIGVRSNEDAPNIFDDKFYLFKGESFIEVASGTTNPGTPVLQGGFLKYNKVGAAVVKSDKWYYGVWKYGLHMGRMPALIQVGLIDVYRDGDRDGKSEEIGTPITGYFGINFHANSYDPNDKVIRENVNDWSAGCSVVNDKQKHLKWMGLMKSQKSVSYVVVNEF
jgi:hypothetical protein